MRVRNPPSDRRAVNYNFSANVTTYMPQLLVKTDSVMPAIGERNVRAEAADIASDAKGTSSFQWEKAFRASIAF